MTRESAVKFLQSPHTEIVEFALSLVNLTKKEHRALCLTVRDGNTNEEAAEIMDVSAVSISGWKRRGLEKCLAVWSGREWIERLIDG